MTVPRPLYWYQGLFLQPHHFQRLERTLEASLLPLREHLQPWLHGVCEVEIQKAALGTRSFGIHKGTFLFPDGTYAAVPGNAVVEPRSFEQAWTDGGKPFPVYIGLRKWSELEPNVTVLDRPGSLSSVSTRFVAAADAEDLPDLHSSGPSGQVKRLHYALRLFWESERDQLGDYAVIPLAQLERMGEEIRLLEQFVPPVVAVSGSDVLSKVVRETRNLIAARSRQLEEYKSQRGIQTSDFGSRDMVYLLALRSLNRYIPLLSHFLEAPSVHPWQIYGVLRQIVGELSAFSDKVDAMGESGGEKLLPAYDHGSLYRCFSSARELIARLLDEVTAGPDHVVRMAFDGTYHAADLKPGVFGGNNRFYLAVRNAGEADESAQALATIAKLGSREQLPLLIARSLPGVAMEHLPVPPSELPRRAGTIYFSLDCHGDTWSSVEKGRNLALYWDGAPEEMDVELMVVEKA